VFLLKVSSNLEVFQILLFSFSRFVESDCESKNKYFFVQNKLSFWTIDAHRGGGRGRGGTSCTPYKDFEKLPHKNAIKTTPPWLSHNPKYPPQKNLPKKPNVPPPPPWLSHNPKYPLKKTQGPPPPGFPTTVHLCFWTKLSLTSPNLT
jgi:hypothetical protein